MFRMSAALSVSDGLSWFEVEDGVWASQPGEFIVRRDDRVGRDTKVFNLLIWYLFRGPEFLQETPDMWRKAIWTDVFGEVKSVAGQIHSEEEVPEPEPEPEEPEVEEEVEEPDPVNQIIGGFLGATLGAAAGGVPVVLVQESLEITIGSMLLGAVLGGISGVFVGGRI